MNDEYSNFGEYLNLRDRKIDPAFKVISRWDPQSIRLWIGKHFAVKELPVMLRRRILDRSKEVSRDAARRFHRRSFSAAASVGGRAGPAGRRLAMAGLQPDR